MKIKGKRVDPPERARGIIARAYLYFEQRYARYNMSRQQRRLMETWDAAYPVTEWECLRNRRIKAIQGNGNPFVERVCN
ncbi:MAG: endonuclease [Mailhella sp.]|nr:endonuclease [Mailhella sp.]